MAVFSTSVSHTSGGNADSPTDKGPKLPVPALAPAMTPIAIEADFIPAANNVTFALQHAAQADKFVQQLGQLLANFTPPTINPVFPVVPQAPQITTVDPPELEPIVFSPPAIPAPFTGTLSIDTSFPTFNGLPPALLFPNAPVPNLGTLPTAPAIDFNFDYPDVDVTLPSAPDLLSISISQFDGVTFPTLNMPPPQLDLVAPQTYAYVAGAPYADALLTETKAFLLDRITNGTGALPAAVEANIYGRDLERELRTQANAIADLDRMEAMGYALPPGRYIDARIKIQTDSMYTMAGSSRDLAVSQAKLAQDAVIKALELSNSIESTLITYSNMREQRNFDAVKYATEAGINNYNAQVQAYGQRLLAYKSMIDFFSAQLEKAKTQVSVYTALVEAEKTKVDANNSLVSQYKTQVDAALATIQVFQGQISLIKTRADIENLKVSTFGEYVKAYAAQANVYSTQVEGYKAGVEAEGAKQSAYASQVQAYGTFVDAKAKSINANIEVFKSQLDVKNTEYTAYKVQVEGATETVKAFAEVNKAIAQIYESEVKGLASYNDSLTKEWEAQITLAEKVAEIGVTAAQASAQLYVSATQVASEAAKVGAQVEAQMAASALSTVTYATHRARQDSLSQGSSLSASTSESFSQQNSSSYGESHSYEESVQPHTSYNYAYGGTDSTVHQINSVA